MSERRGCQRWIGLCHCLEDVAIIGEFVKVDTELCREIHWLLYTTCRISRDAVDECCPGLLNQSRECSPMNIGQHNHTKGDCNHMSADVMVRWNGAGRHVDKHRIIDTESKLDESTTRNKVTFAHFFVNYSDARLFTQHNHPNKKADSHQRTVPFRYLCGGLRGLFLAGGLVILFHVRSPEGEVITQQLHDQGRVPRRRFVSVAVWDCLGARLTCKILRKECPTQQWHRRRPAWRGDKLGRGC